MITINKLLVIVFVMIGAKTKISMAEDEKCTTATKVSFTTIDQGGYSGIENERKSIFRTNNEFVTFWKEHKSNTMPVPKAPTIDLDSQRNKVAAAIFLGTKNSGGYGLTIDSVDVTNDNADGDYEAVIQIHYETTEPLPGYMVTMALTQPYYIIEIVLPATINLANAEFKFIGANAESSNKEKEGEPLRFLITFTNDVMDRDTVLRSIEENLSDYVTSTKLLATVKIGFVDVDLNNKVINAENMKELLLQNDGVASVELDS